MNAYTGIWIWGSWIQVSRIHGYRYLGFMDTGIRIWGPGFGFMDTRIQGSWIKVSRVHGYRFPGFMDIGIQGSWI